MTTALPPAPARQPVTVRIAVVLIYLSGFVNVGVGILVLLSRYRVEADAVLAVSLLGAGIILFGLLTVAVASGVARGRRLARVLLSVYLGVQFALDIVTIVTADTWDWTSVAEMIVCLFIAVAVWAPPGSRYFAAGPAGAAAAGSAAAGDGAAATDSAAAIDAAT